MPGQDSPNDANGVAITVGATVKLVGTVASLNLFDNRFNDVVITLSHPVAGQLPTFLTGGDSSQPGYKVQISVPPNVLLVGS